MKTTTLALMLMGSFAAVPAMGQVVAPHPRAQEHATVSKAPATPEAKGPAPDDGQWHFAGEPLKRSEIRHIFITALPIRRPAAAHPAAHPESLPKPAAMTAHEPLIESGAPKPVSASVPVKPPAVVSHRGPSFNDQPHRGPNPAIIVGVAANARSSNTGAIDGTAFHRKP